MSSDMKVASVNVSQIKGTIKKPVDKITITDRGIEDDAHAGLWHRQISLLSKEDVDVFAQQAGREIAFGEFAENITTSGIDLGKVSVLDRLVINGVELEITQIGKKCHGSTCAIFKELGKCVMPDKGLFCRVISTGVINPGDEIQYLPKDFKVLILTVSDRAFAGKYEDRSGPAAVKMTEEFFSDKRWHLVIENTIVPDEPDKIKKNLQNAIAQNYDIIFTLGGTGVGPRDITPEVVLDIAEKTIPGIMENIRIKYSSDKPSALLSRSVAAVSGNCQIYALPGSVRAGKEYLTEIFKTLEHMVYMIYALDVH